MENTSKKEEEVNTMETITPVMDQKGIRDTNLATIMTMEIMASTAKSTTRVITAITVATRRSTTTKVATTRPTTNRERVTRPASLAKRRATRKGRKPPVSTTSLIKTPITRNTSFTMTTTRVGITANMATSMGIMGRNMEDTRKEEATNLDTMTTIMERRDTTIRDIMRKITKVIKDTVDMNHIIRTILIMERREVILEARSTVSVAVVNTRRVDNFFSVTVDLFMLIYLLFTMKNKF